MFVCCMCSCSCAPRSVLNLFVFTHAVCQKAKDKWNKHGRNYDVIGYAFAPCVMTTYGQIHGHLLRLLYVLAKKPG